VTCLAVSGSRAVIGTAKSSELLIVQDNDAFGAGPDTIGGAAPLIGTPWTSPVTVAPGLGPYPLTSGDIEVLEAPVLPTSTEQCKNRGWQSFPQFKNQGDCVSFVATHGRNQPG